MNTTRLGIMVAALLVLTTAGILLARDAMALEPLLAAAQDELVAAQAAVEDGDEDTARAALRDAGDAIAAARNRADGPLWAAAGWVPRYGASARAVQGGVELADATAELATLALDQALTLVQEGADAFVGPGGQVQTTALAETADALEALPLARLVEVRDRLAEMPASGLVGPTEGARDVAVARATRVIDQLERGRVGARTFAGFLGAEGPRAYLLAVQNPAELRGTGGLISVLAELVVEDGRIDARPAGGDDLVDDRITSGGQQTVGFDLDPVDRPEDFAERYDSNAGGAIIQSVNLDPDLPTVGPVLLELYEQRTGRQVDGAVLVDPFALAAFIDATGGPLPLPDAARVEAPTLPEALTSDNTARTLLVDVYDAFGGTNPARSDFDEGVTLAVLQRLSSGEWDPAVLARALADAAAARRLQLHSTDEVEQDGFVRLGIGGAMTRADDVVDVLAVTGVNAGPDKSDAHVSHRLTADVTLRARPGAVPWQVLRDTLVTVEVDNPLAPDDHDDYITGTNEPAPVGTGSPRARNALSRTWFSIWTPGATELAAVRDGVNGEVLRSDRIHGHHVTDYFLETPSRSTAAFSAPLTGPLELDQVGGRHLYELVLWRQAKAIPDVWDLTITPPVGLTVDEVELDGGGPPHTGLGPAAPQALEASVDNGRVRVAGTVTRDVTVKVWLQAD